MKRYVYMSEMSRLTVERIEGKLVVRDQDGRSVDLSGMSPELLRQTLDFLGYSHEGDSIEGEYIRAA